MQLIADKELMLQRRSSEWSLFGLCPTFIYIVAKSICACFSALDFHMTAARICAWTSGPLDVNNILMPVLRPYQCSVLLHDVQAAQLLSRTMRNDAATSHFRVSSGTFRFKIITPGFPIDHCGLICC